MDSLRVARVDHVQLDQYLPPITASSASSSASTPSTKPTRHRRTGTLHLTPHHLIFSETSTSKASEPEIWIPYPSITLMTRLPQNIQGLYPVRIETRYFNNYIMSFEKDREGGAEDVWQSVKDSAVKTSVHQLHAFFYHDPHSSRSADSSIAKGWTIYNPRQEFARQGLGSKTKSWRFTDINKDYSFSPTYPAKLAVPTRISDSTLSYAAKYRSKARIPALTYLHWANSASITRSSQPMVGLKNSRSAQDERLVECIFSTHLYPDAAYASPIYGATTTNLIIDARPTTNAMANVAMGAGTENMENYKSGKKAYLGIDNIHVMRNSLKIINEAIRDAETKPAGVLDRGLLRKSNWLKHISTILDGSLLIIRNIHLNASHVLIHCSDGWDRTAQLSAVAQICLDPFYRTIDGLAILIEKDFLSFGHKFLDRSGHMSSEKLFIEAEGEEDSDEEGVGAQKAAQAFFASVQKQFRGTSHLKETSPVFHQFLDCIRQIQRQFPERFEFNERYLLDIFYHLYSCQFGTFLFNNERERQNTTPGPSYVERTASVWDYLHQSRSTYLNESFDSELDRQRDDQGVLLFDPKDVQFWFRLFRRGDEEMNGSPLTLAQAQGAEMLGPLGAGQEDPITPSPTIASIARAVSPPSSWSMTDTNPVSTENGSTIGPSSTPRRAGGGGGVGGGWGWSQFSTGAFNAVSSAAREIKSISTDAIAQLKAEANEVDGDWRREPTATTLANGRTATGVETTYAPYTRQAVRIPSESNPWSTDSQIQPNTNRFASTATNDNSIKAVSTSPREEVARNNTINGSLTHGQAQKQTQFPPARPQGLNARLPSATNPWATMSSTPTPTLTPPPPSNMIRSTTPHASGPGQRSDISSSLSDLKLIDKSNTDTMISRSASDNGGRADAKKDMVHGGGNSDDDVVRAAMGDDKKAWDPLGAL
ncbi:myotubularin [Kwoniella heveanensis CBS 569]|nr:myotubularin [Kwoniella heveanensis CBS 569]